MSSRTWRIVVSLPLNFDHFRRILLGVRNYAAALGGLRIIHTQGFHETIWDDASSDGFLLVLPDDAAGESALGSGRPVINISNRSVTAGVAKVVNDDMLTGELAARHLMQCGYQRFFFLGNDLHFARLRLEGFRAALEAAGHRVSNLSVPLPAISTVQEFVQWRQAECAAVRSALRKGSAFFFATAAHLHVLLQDLELDPSAEVLPYGFIAGDAPDTVLSSDLSLTHVDIDCEKIGWCAAERMHRHLLGLEPLGADAMLLAPCGLVRGNTTVVQKTADVVVQRARLAMAQIPLAELSAAAVADALNVNRKTLYEHFVKATGTSLAHEIKALKLAEAMRLLRQTGLNVADIAQQLGYAKESAFIHAFRIQTGQTPGAYRRG